MNFFEDLNYAIMAHSAVQINIHGLNSLKILIQITIIRMHDIITIVACSRRNDRHRASNSTRTVRFQIIDSIIIIAVMQTAGNDERPN